MVRIRGQKISQRNVYVVHLSQLDTRQLPAVTQHTPHDDTPQ